jgi:hypothetical protein
MQTIDGLAAGSVPGSASISHDTVRETIQFLIDMLDAAEADGEDREPGEDCEPEDDSEPDHDNEPDIFMP